MALTYQQGGFIRAGTIVDAQVSSSAAIASGKLADGANWIKKDGSVTMTGALNLGGQLLNNLGPGVSGTDGVNLNQLNSAIQGLTPKASVRVKATGNVTVSNPATSTFDGVALSSGDAMLLGSQTTGSENGIYVFNGSSSALTRRNDADSAAKLVEGSMVVIDEGTINGTTSWFLSTSGTITLGTTSLTFSQLSGANQVTAGNGINKSGTVISAVANTAQAINVTGSGIGITVDPATGNPIIVSSSGIKLSLASGHLLIGNSGGVAADVAPSGDVASISNAGAFTLSSAVRKSSNFIHRETPAGAMNGSNTTFTLANTPLSGTEYVFLNSGLMDSGVGNDYTISGATITMLTPAPTSVDKIRVSYQI